MKSFIRELKKLNTSGIITVDHVVHNCSSIAGTLFRLLPELTDRSKIKILEINIADPIIRSIKAGIWKDLLELKGYGKPWVLKNSVRRVDGSSKYLDDTKAFLEASNTYQSLVLGVFSSLEELEKFRNEFYPSNKIRSVVIASNEDTKKYYASL